MEETGCSETEENSIETSRIENRTVEKGSNRVKMLQLQEKYIIKLIYLYFRNVVISNRYLYCWDKLLVHLQLSEFKMTRCDAGVQKIYSLLIKKITLRKMT